LCGSIAETRRQLMTQTIQGYPVYTRGQSAYCLFQDGDEYWAMNLDDTKPGSFGSGDQARYALDANKTCTPREFDAHAKKRQKAADDLRARYFGPVNGNFKQMTFFGVIYLLEAEYISALAAQEANPGENTLATRVKSARDKLFWFWKRYKFEFEKLDKPYY